MTIDPATRPFFLALRLDDDPHAACLLLDARDPVTLVEAPDLDHLDALPAAALVLVDGRDAEPCDAVDDRMFVTRGFVWSLLDPIGAGRRARRVVSDRLAAEQSLRDEGYDLWEGLCRWRDLPADLTGGIRDTLAQFSARIGTVVDALNAMSTTCHSNPFAGWNAAQPFTGETAPQPTCTPLPDDPDDLAAWMTAPEGLGVLHGDTFQVREGQGDMARDVAGALLYANPLLLEAGTGIGKTHAYLTALLAHLRRTGERGIVSTHTRTLQHQILDHDLPSLSPVAPDIVTRQLMGRGNYLCRTRLLRFRERSLDSLPAAWAAVSFELWLLTTTEGLREEVEDHPAIRANLRELFDSPEPCSPSVCYGRDECYVQRARRLAREAQLVVVNHSLLMHDFAAGHTLVGDYQVLVVDEAHRLPQVALDCFEKRCDPARVLVIEDLLGPRGQDRSLSQLPRLIRNRLRSGGEQAAAAIISLERFDAMVNGVVAAYRRWFEAVSRQFAIRVEEENVRPHGRLRVLERDELFGPVAAETAALLTACGEAGAAYSTFANRLEGAQGEDPRLEDELATLSRISELVMWLESDVLFLSDREDPDWVVWLEPDPGASLAALGATRLESGPLLTDLWRKSELTPVLTSATLGVGEDFTFMSRELGVVTLSRGLVESLIHSPFDYETQSLFMTTPEFPAPDSRHYLPSVSHLLRGLLAAVPRKTLVLFTSYAALKTVAETLQKDEDDGYAFKLDLERHWKRSRPVILAQGGGLSPAELMARFRRESRAVLLGTNTFWEGVDLPGADLEMLVVTKLPFLVPADPWVAARCDRMQAEGENPFVKFMVRDAVLRLRQGIGRLIRSDADRGVVCLLDSRLHGKPYGKTFLDAMPTSVRYCAGPEEMITDAATFFADS
jgi:ATP-dependent DNA helicase DinG